VLLGDDGEDNLIEVPFVVAAGGSPTRFRGRISCPTAGSSRISPRCRELIVVCGLYISGQSQQRQTSV
jgi:hypothetical protein